EYVYSFIDGFAGKRATISMMLEHNSGQLSKVLDIIAANKGNILTISQGMPIEQKASVTITMDISDMSTTFGNLSKDIESMAGVYKYRLEAIESTEI
ncbi:hypothetical protein LJB89_03500, partial [Tyzzerella sp. OttesenSCG-928-J15]|nr:hypothetical protein [Tyzzerella sp. OttesenSCG-928-J15]